VLSQLIPLAFSNLLRMRMRLLLTIGGVTIGSSAVILLIAFALGLQSAAESSLGSSRVLTEIFVTSKGDTTAGVRLTSDDAKKLVKVPGVQAIIPEIALQNAAIVAAQYTAYRQVVGLDPAVLQYVGVLPNGTPVTMASGEGIGGSDLGKNFTTVTSTDAQGKPKSEPVDVDVLKTPIQVQITKISNQTSTIRLVDVKLNGQFSSGTNYDNMLILPLSDVLQLNAWTSGTKVDPTKTSYDKITVIVESRDVTRKTSLAIQKMGYLVSGLGELLDQINNLFSTMRLVLGGIGLIALLIAASGVANTMMMATLERAKEIGLMKAVGATNQDILGLFLLEAGMIGCAGGLSGVGLSLMIRDVINHALKNPASGPGGSSFIPIDMSKLTEPVIIPSNLMLIGILLATAICMGAGLYPALWAARLPPVVALKQE